MNKRYLLLSLVVSAGTVLLASAAEPSVSVVDRQDNKSSTPRSEIARINLGSENVEIVKRNGETLSFDKAAIARILLSDSDTGIDEIYEGESPVSVSPRMTEDIVNITGAEASTPYYLFDINGHLRISGRCMPDGTSLSLGAFDKGLYLLVVGESTYKIVKK